MTSLLENRKSLYQQIVDSQMQFEAVDAKLQQLQPLANLGMAWAMTAHELNNLLTPIVSYAQLALQNASLVAHSLGIGHFYTGWVLAPCRAPMARAWNRRIPSLIGIPVNFRPAWVHPFSAMWVHSST